MMTDEEANQMCELQQLHVDMRLSRREQQLVAAAEAHHRQRILNRLGAVNADNTPLEHLAEEWIAMLHDSSGDRGC